MPGAFLVFPILSEVFWRCPTFWSCQPRVSELCQGFWGLDPTLTWLGQYPVYEASSHVSTHQQGLHQNDSKNRCELVLLVMDRDTRWVAGALEWKFLMYNMLWACLHYLRIFIWTQVVTIQYLGFPLKVCVLWFPFLSYHFCVLWTLVSYCSPLGLLSICFSSHMFTIPFIPHISHVKQTLRWNTGLWVRTRTPLQFFGQVSAVLISDICTPHLEFTSHL